MRLVILVVRWELQCFRARPRACWFWRSWLPDARSPFVIPWVVVQVDGIEHAPPFGLLEARYEFGAEDVDLPVQQPAPVRHFLRFNGQLVDEFLQILVGKRGEVREIIRLPDPRPM